nr:MAG: hypothetical protein [Sanya fiers-like virus 13]UUW21259.1 MAG: hypothetical protein [Sanya fiers-like virus 13]
MGARQMEAPNRFNLPLGKLREAPNLTGNPMSITLQSASGVNVVFDLVKSSGSSQVFQNIGTSFQDARTLTQSQTIGKTGTAKSRFVLKVPYTYTEGSVVKTDYDYFVLEATVKETSPLVDTDKGVYMLKTLAALTSTSDLMARRKFSAS